MDSYKGLEALSLASEERVDVLNEYWASEAPHKL